MNNNDNILKYIKPFRKNRPAAMATIKGSPMYPNIYGTVNFYQTKLGVVVSTEVWGLPFEIGMCKENVFAYHIHSGKSCTGNVLDPFANVGGHFNPHGCQHPQHAGDLPPLFGNKGYALSAVLTDRFTVDSIIGNTIIIHRMPDDFKTQPSGNAGEKIACGVIKRI